jgi:hypothetical protein
MDLPHQEIQKHVQQIQLRPAQPSVKMPLIGYGQNHFETAMDHASREQTLRLLRKL